MKTMDQLRDEVDAIDTKILDLLSKRMELVEKIAVQKKNSNLSIVDKKREEQVKQNWILKGRSLDLQNKQVQNILEEILEMSKEKQGRIRK